MPHAAQHGRRGQPNAQQPHGPDRNDHLLIKFDQHEPLPDAPLGVRIRTSPRLRRFVPNALAVARARRKAKRLWRRDPDLRARSRREVELIVSNTRWSERLEELAYLRAVENEIARTLLWQPWKVSCDSAASRTNMAEALSRKSFIVSFCHLGPFHCVTVPLQRAGREIIYVSDPWIFEPPEASYWGRRVVRIRQGVAGKARHIAARGSYSTLRSLLREGAAVGIAFDVPGGRQTRFLGKEVWLADGTARLAAETGVAVIPARTRRVKGRVVCDYAEALLPEKLRTVEAIHDALAWVHEQFILEEPHCLEDPGRPGSWGAGATTTAWRKPSQ